MQMLLDDIIESQKKAREKLASGEMLHDEEREVLLETANLKSKRKKTMQPQKTYESETTASLQAAMDKFDVVNCSRKDIKELRKLLSSLKNEKFPKVRKEK